MLGKGGGKAPTLYVVIFKGCIFHVKGLSFSHSRILISRMAAVDHILVFMYNGALYTFTNHKFPMNPPPPTSSGKLTAAPKQPENQVILEKCLSIEVAERA